MRNRAWRRWQYQKRKKSRKHYWGGPFDQQGTGGCSEKKRLGMVVNTPQACSCFGGCGHMRAAYEPTMQERRAPRIEDWDG